MSIRFLLTGTHPPLIRIIVDGEYSLHGRSGNRKEDQYMGKQVCEQLKLISCEIAEPSLTEDEDRDREPPVAGIETEADFTSFLELRSN
jgi:hypothetical protein